MIKPMPQIKLEMGPTGRDCDIFVDGERVIGAQSVNIHAEVGQSTKVDIHRRLTGIAQSTAEGTVDPEDLTILPSRLGLVSTRELLDELATRLEVTQNSTNGRKLAALCREALDKLAPGVLDYRTVAA